MMDEDIKKILKFTLEEKRLKSIDDRHTDSFSKGFISACNIIISYIEGEIIRGEAEEVLR